MLLAAAFGEAPHRADRTAAAGTIAGQQAVRAEPRPPSTPVRLYLPDIKVDALLESVDGDQHGGIGTPPLGRAGTPAWFTGGAMPGSSGSAVVIGHVDDRTGPAVFFRLSELRPGHRISVRRADGTTAVFAMESRQYVAKAAFPFNRVLGRTDGARLALVTCAPPFDAKRGEYLGNLIVYARLVAWA